MPSIQKKIIKQAKFTYSSLGKAFEKVTKTIKDQGKKQIETIKDNKKQLANTNKHSYENELLFSKEKEVTKKINYDELKFTVQSTGEESKVDDPVVFLKDVRTGKITPEKADDLQEEFNKHLKEIRIGKK